MLQTGPGAKSAVATTASRKVIARYVVDALFDRVTVLVKLGRGDTVGDALGKPLARRDVGRWVEHTVTAKGPTRRNTSHVEN